MIKKSSFITIALTLLCSFNLLAKEAMSPLKDVVTSSQYILVAAPKRIVLDQVAMPMYSKGKADFILYPERIANRVELICLSNNCQGKADLKEFSLSWERGEDILPVDNIYPKLLFLEYSESSSKKLTIPTAQYDIEFFNNDYVIELTTYNNICFPSEMIKKDSSGRKIVSITALKEYVSIVSDDIGRTTIPLESCSPYEY